MSKRAQIVASAIALSLPALVLAFQVGYRVGSSRRPAMTTLRLAPDEQIRATLIETVDGGQGDRVVSIRLERTQGPREVVRLDVAGAAGHPIGTERFVWSRDGTRVVLVGRHFFVRANLMLTTGDQAFWFHDLRSGRSWINSETDVPLAALTTDLFAGVEFTEPVIFRPVIRVNPDSTEKRE